MLAHVSFFGRNPREATDFLAHPFPKAYQRYRLALWVPRCWGVAHSASGPKAAQALGCSITPSLRVRFSRVTCMALAASVPRLWTLSLLPVCCACNWVRTLQLRPLTGWGPSCVCTGLDFHLRPGIPGRGPQSLCLGTDFASISPFLVEVRGVRI